jgi:polysaccharide biosynthesis transport protein
MESIQTPGDVLIILKRRKWSLIIPFVSITLISVIVAFNQPPIHKAITTIMIEQQDIPMDYVRSAVTTFAEQQMQIINQRIMSSTRLLEIINKLNLYSDLKKNMMPEDIVELMRKDIELDPVSVDVVDPRTGRPSTIAFTISYSGKGDPAKVLEVANVLASLFLEENSEMRKRQATEVTKFLEDELEKVKTDRDRINSEVARFKEKHTYDLPELMQHNMQSISDIQRNLDLLNSQLTQLNEREGDLKTQLATTPKTLIDTNHTRLKELKARLADLKNQYSDKHPDVIKTKAEIKELEAKLKLPSNNEIADQIDNPTYITLNSQLSDIESDKATVSAQVLSLNERLNEYKRNVVLTPHVESEYKTLVTEQENLQLKYDDLMKKHMEAKVSQGLEKQQKGERFSILDPARMPKQPYKQKRFAIIFLGILLGITSGIGTASIREYSDTSVHSSNMLTKATSYPVLANIPFLVPKKEIEMRKVMRILMGVFLLVIVLLGFIVMHFFSLDGNFPWAEFAMKLAK